MKNHLKLFLLFFIILSVNKTFGQVSVSTYSIHAIGISTDNDKKISGELKAFLNRESENIIFEPTIMYNFRQQEYHQISIGIGFSAYPFTEIDGANGITIPVQLEISPIEKVKNLSILMEIAPQIGAGFSSPVRTLWGVRYAFR